MAELDKTVFVDHFQKPGFEPNSHEVNEDLRAIHFKVFLSIISTSHQLGLKML